MTALVEIPHSKIAPGPLNPRKTFNDDAIAELAQSIKANGVLQNLTVRPDPAKKGHYQIIAGERRWRAVQKLIADKAEKKTYPMPARIKECDDREFLRLALLENVQRDDLQPMEEAEGYKALVDAGEDTKTIADMIGKTVRHVQLRLALVDKLDPRAQDMLRSGQINLAAARELAAAPAAIQSTVVENATEYDQDIDTRNIRFAINRGLPKVDRWPIFDVSKYDGDIVDGFGDSRHFADVEQANRLQREAIKDLVAKLEARKDVAFIIRSKSPYSDPVCRDLEYASEGDPGAGILLSIDDDLSVGIHWRQKKHAAAANAASAAPQPMVTVKHMERARDRKTIALQTAAAEFPAVAARITILSLIDGDACTGITARHTDAHPIAPQVAGLLDDLVDTLSKAGAPLNRTGCRLHHDLYGDAGRNWRMRAWQALVDMPDSAIMDTFAAIVASRINVGRLGNNTYADCADAIAFAETLDVAGKEAAHGLTLQPEDLDGIRSAGLDVIAGDLGIDVAGTTAKSKRQAILDRTGQGDQADIEAIDDYVLPAFHFGDSDAITSRIAGKPETDTNPADDDTDDAAGVPKFLRSPTPIADAALAADFEEEAVA